MSDLETHLKQVRNHLERFKNAGIANLINGMESPGKTTFETRSPVDESLICAVARGDAEDIDDAAKAAKAAFPEWAAMTGPGAQENSPQDRRHDR